MALAHSKVTAQGQVSVPAKVRQRLGVGPGSVLEWDEDGERVIVRKAGRYSSEDIHRALFSKTPKRRTGRGDEERNPAVHQEAPCGPLTPTCWCGSMTRDDVKQVAVAEAFVANGAWVPHLAVAEATWVLVSVYDRGPEAVATAVDMLLSHEHLTVQDAEVVAAAVAQLSAAPEGGVLRLPHGGGGSEGGAHSARYV